MMEAVRPPLGHIKERQVGATRPPAMHRDCLGGEALLGCQGLFYPSWATTVRTMITFAAEFVWTPG